ncbi:unnamed protein product [Choristocarpus tenellus]
MRVQRCNSLHLSFAHKNRVDFILHQIPCNCKTHRTGLDTIHIDEAWFYLIHEREMVHMFPREEKEGSAKVQHKGHILKVMFISAVSRPNPSHDFDSKVGIWCVCVANEVQWTTAQNMKGKEDDMRSMSL